MICWTCVLCCSFVCRFLPNMSRICPCNSLFLFCFCPEAIYTCMNTCAYVHIHISVCVCVCACAYYVYIYIYIYIYNPVIGFKHYVFAIFFPICSTLVQGICCFWPPNRILHVAILPPPWGDFQRAGNVKFASLMNTCFKQSLFVFFRGVAMHTYSYTHTRTPIYIYIYIYIYMYIHTYLSTYIYIYIYIHTYIYIYIYIYIYVCMHMHTCTYACSCIGVLNHRCVHS